MKIAVIAAGGKLGKKVVRQALDRGFEVKGFVHHMQEVDARAEILEKSLFDMTAEDIIDCDAVISAYGSGFQGNPELNLQAFGKYPELGKGCRHLAVIAGAGSLYQDAAHRKPGYEEEGYPPFLREISRYTRLGIDRMKEDRSFVWTVICPSAIFDPDGPLTGRYQVRTDEQPVSNGNRKSCVSYADMAAAMLDCVEKDLWKNEVVSIEMVD